MKEWLTLNEALSYCSKYGKELTRAGLKHLALVNRFVRKAKDDYHNEYNIKGLKKIIKKSKPRKGYININDVVKEFKIDFGKAYRIIYKYKIKTKRFGLSNIIYFKRKDFIDAKEKHNNKKKSNKQRDKRNNNEKAKKKDTRKK
jgi:hypothetical protein